MLLDQLIDQIVGCFQRNELKRGLSIDGYYDRFIVAKLTILAQLRLRLTQRNDFHEP